MPVSIVEHSHVAKFDLFLPWSENYTEADDLLDGNIFQILGWR